VFGDGPRNEGERPAVEAARAVARDSLGNHASYHFAECNKGLAKSIIDGVDALTREYGRAIVIEDDLSVHAYFLTYMNDALARYAEDEHVYQVSGHMFEVPEFANRHSAIVLPLTTTWGWGTWDRAWRRFEEAPFGWEQLQTDRMLRKRFNLGGAYDFASMADSQVAGRNNSWGIRWYWTVFRLGGVGVFPPQTLVRNLGMDGSGTHGAGLFRRFSINSLDREVISIGMPAPKVLETDVDAVRRALYRQNGGAVGWLIDVIKKRIRAPEFGAAR
jgi:hypothetical protein